jgi:hypothetical protein
MLIDFHLHPYYESTFQYCPEDVFKAVAADVQPVIDPVRNSAR